MTTLTARLPSKALALARLRWFLVTGLWGYLWAATKFVGREIGYTATGVYVLMLAFWRWKTCARIEETFREQQRFASKEGLQLDHRPLTIATEKAEARTKVSGLVAGISLVLLWLFWAKNPGVVGPIILSLPVLGAVLCNIVGRRYVPAGDPDTAPPISPMRDGLPVHKLKASIRDVLKFSKPHPIDVKIIGTTVHENGWIFQLYTPGKLTQDHLRELERELQIGKGFASLITNPDDASRPTLRLFQNDPLAGAVTPEKRPPLSLSCREPFSLTRSDDGTRPGFNVLGVHQFWVGSSGTGKSSAIWTLLDWLVDCADAEVYGIDFTNGPVFGAYKKLMSGVAYTAERAHEFLDNALEMSLARNRELEADDDAEDENFSISATPGRKAVFIVIDEYSALAQEDKALKLKIEKLMKIGRKARVHVILSSPAADKKSLGDSTVPIAQAMTVVAFGIPMTMVTHVLGPGSLESGWTPHLFVPASAGSAGDSGKCFIKSPDFSSPQVQRFDRLTKPEIIARNQKRLAMREAESWTIPAAAHDRLEQIAEEVRQIPAQEPVSDVAEPDMLVVKKLRVFLDETTAERYSTTTINNACGTSTSGFKKALRNYGSVVEQKPMRVDGKVTPGYERETLVSAVE